MQKPLLRYEIRCFGRDGRESEWPEPAAYQATDPAAAAEFKNRVHLLFSDDFMYCKGRTDENGCLCSVDELPPESPAVELRNGGECAVRITMDTDYFALFNPCFEENLYLSREYQHRRDYHGMYFDIFTVTSFMRDYARNPCEAEYLALFDAALAEYEHRAEPGPPVEVKWRPALYMTGFYRPLEPVDLQDFLKRRGEFYDWYNAPYRLVWDDLNSYNRPYGADLPQAAKAGTVAAIFDELEYFTRGRTRRKQRFNRDYPLPAERRHGRDWCSMHLTDDWNRYSGSGKKLVLVFAEILNEAAPDRAKIGAIVKVLDDAVRRFEAGEMKSVLDRGREVFV